MCLHETKSCGRCHSSFECKVGNIAQCQCNGISLSDEEKQYLSAHYSDCLCRNCLLEIKRELKFKPIEEKLQFLQSTAKTR